jgi:hypothetical protein
MKPIQIKPKDMLALKKSILTKQKFFCAICGQSMAEMESRNICLDHNHKTGRIRAVLCRACNQLEGRVTRLYVRLGLKNRGVDYISLLHSLAKYSKIKDKKRRH